MGFLSFLLAGPILLGAVTGVLLARRSDRGGTGEAVSRKPPSFPR